MGNLRGWQGKPSVSGRRRRFRRPLRRLRRLLADLVRDNAFGRAAELAYFFLLTLFPLLIILLSLFSFIDGIQDALRGWLANLMPPQALGLVESWLVDFVAQRNRGVIPAALLFALWTASTGMSAVISTLNAAYNVAETRPFWKISLLAIGLTVISATLCVGGHLLLLSGSWLIEWLSSPVLGAGQGTAWGRLVSRSLWPLWSLFRYLTAVLLLILSIDLVFFLAPNLAPAARRWQWVSPGATFAVVASILASTAFSVYLRHVPGYNLIYGSLGAFIILLIWMYLLGLALFIGAEINHHLWRHPRHHSPARSGSDHRN